LRVGGRGLKIVAMTNRTLTLQLEPHADGELIAGWVCDQRGEEHRFVGWLGLLTLIEQARLAAAYDSHGASRGGTGRRAPRNEYGETSASDRNQ
jgi:hypothetical protein